MGCLLCASEPNECGPGCGCHHAPCIHDRNAEIASLAARVKVLEEALRGLHLEKAIPLEGYLEAKIFITTDALYAANAALGENWDTHIRAALTPPAQSETPADEPAKPER